MLISTATKNEHTRGKYPCLMITTDGLIVLFSDKGKGTVVHTESNTNYILGTYGSYWSMEAFKPYSGRVTIE